MRSKRLLQAIAGKHAPHATAALLAALLAFSGWQFLISVRALASPIPPIATVRSPSYRRQISANDIANAHLFGVAEITGASRTMTTLPSSWQVIGIIVSDSPQESMADVVVDGAEQLWHVGDRLPDGSRLAEINGDGIKTTGSTALLPFELGPASLDDRALQTDARNDNSIDAIAVTPTALPDTGAALPDRMNALRTAGVAIWLKRVQQAPKALPAKSPHH